VYTLDSPSPVDEQGVNVNNDNIVKRRAAYHHGNLRPALIAATLRAIADDGPDGFTLRDVARRAGVSPAAPYRHFADKDELLAAVASDCTGRLGAAVAEARARAHAHPLAQFRATGIAYIQFAAAHPEHFRAMTTPGLEARLPPEDRARLDEVKAAQRAELAAAQAAGHIAAIPLDELLLAANALVHGLAHLIVEGQLGPVDAVRATELAIAATRAIGVGFIPRTDGLPDDHLRPAAPAPSPRRSRRHTEG
jgi:AcrR family transcriptional regulator